MPIGKIETVILNVKDIDDALRFYRELLGAEFEPVKEYTLPGGIGVKDAYCPAVGIGLLQQVSPPTEDEGVRAVTVRVANLQEARARMERLGIPVLRELRSERAHLVEAVYRVKGYLLILVQHDD